MICFGGSNEQEYFDMGETGPPDWFTPLVLSICGSSSVDFTRAAREYPQRWRVEKRSMSRRGKAQVVPTGPRARTEIVALRAAIDSRCAH
jgi:hypothetical protein